jgi:hypothetical protein
MVDIIRFGFNIILKSFFCFYLALNKQIEDFEDLFLTMINNKENEKSHTVLYPIGNAVQVKRFLSKIVSFIYMFAFD